MREKSFIDELLNKLHPDDASDDMIEIDDRDI